MRVLITGAGGFIGANLTRRMVSMGHQVHVLLHPQSNSWRLKDIFSSITIHSKDLKDSIGVRQILASVKPEWIFHLAVHGAYSWQNQDGEILSTNVLGTINLLQNAIEQGFDAFINTGSSSEYGFKNYPPKETEWLEPNSTYSASKIAATLFCQHQAISKNLRIATMRLYSVYGPWEEPKRLVPALICNGLSGKFPPLTNPATARDYIFVEDVIDAYILAAEKISHGKGDIFNVGTGIQTTIQQLITVSDNLFPNRGIPNWGSMEGRNWDTDVWVSDPTKLKNLGWKPKIPLKEGLEIFTNWMCETKSVIDFYQSKLLPQKFAA